jgi:hypothetical protein
MNQNTQKYITCPLGALHYCKEQFKSQSTVDSRRFHVPAVYLLCCDQGPVSRSRGETSPPHPHLAVPTDRNCAAYIALTGSRDGGQPRPSPHNARADKDNEILPGNFKATIKDHPSLYDKEVVCKTSWTGARKNPTSHTHKRISGILILTVEPPAQTATPFPEPNCSERSHKMTTTPAAEDEALSFLFNS